MKLYYGWVIVAVGVVVGCVGMGGLMSFGVFLLPMADSLGWSRAEISTGSTLAFLSMGIGGFLWGRLYDRYGARVVVLFGGLLQGLGLVLASQAQSLPWFLAAYGMVAGLAVGAVYVPLTAATASWFTRHRSLAVSLVSAGLALGTTLIAPFARWLIVTHDWRFAMCALGLMAWAVIVPAALLLRPVVIGETTTAIVAERTDMTLAQALRTPVFWSLALANFACCAAHSGPIFHMVSYAAECGVAPLTAATVLGAAGLAALSGRIVCGLLADRMGAKHTLVACLALQAVAIALYLPARDLSTLYAVSMLFGFSYGGAMPLYAILVREYFPAAIMGSVFGVVAMISTLGMALGAPVGGWLFDHFRGYGWLYVASSAIGVAAALIAMTVRAHRVPTVAVSAAV
ncbi:MFS transporter [Acidisphaera sp. S103]|uniref:MFS transporter n=1 Tax=Acidisphaera sp. S103 TaxID=1747223 RepID=UPI00131E9377|nr:MFS transporter [Acidisphaera sp. S103]